MTISEHNVLLEWMHSLRNANILSTAVRGVTTETDTDTLTADTEYIINEPDVKNIRSIEVATVTLVFGVDYTYDIDAIESSVKVCRITFTTAQTGALEVVYDKGADRIFPDFAQPTLSISSFPRIGTDIIDMPTVDKGNGGVTETDINITTVVYAQSIDQIRTVISLIRDLVVQKKRFVYIGKYVRVSGQGPILPMPREQGKGKVFQKNIDIKGRFNYEQ